MGYGALATVQTGWTGSVTVDALDAVVPFRRESVVSLLARVTNATYLASSRDLVWDVSSGGVLTVTERSGLTFDIVFTGTCATLTGFTGGPYTGASTYTAAVAYSGAWVPAYGARMSAPMLSVQSGAMTGASGYASAPHRTSTRRELVAWHSSITLPSTSDEHDYWHDGRWFGRFVITDTVLVPLSTYLRSHTTTRIELSLAEVS